MGRLILRAALGHSDIDFLQINDPAGGGGQHDRHTFDVKAGAALADRPSPVRDGANPMVNVDLDRHVVIVTSHDSDAAKAQA